MAADLPLNNRGFVMNSSFAAARAAAVTLRAFNDSRFDPFDRRSAFPSAAHALTVAKRWGRILKG
jgi:hypothetical protein